MRLIIVGLVLVLALVVGVPGTIADPVSTATATGGTSSSPSTPTVTGPPGCDPMCGSTGPT